MGRNARLKKLRKLFGDQKPKGLDKMIQCPKCGAYSYARKYSYPKNEEEKDAILCGSCLLNLTPYIEKYKKEKEAERAVEKISDSPQEAPLEISG